MIYNPGGRWWAFKRIEDLYGESGLPMETYWSIWFFIRTAFRVIDIQYEYERMFESWSGR